MDAATTGRGRLAAQCRKHASAPPARFRPRIEISETTVLPAQRPDRRPWRTERASGTSVAGDDPVNNADPSGMCIIGAVTFGLVGCPPANITSQISYWGKPVVPTGPGTGYMGLGEFIASENVNFTVTGVGNLFVSVYNEDNQGTDTSFTVCLDAPNPQNQCQSADETFDRTMVTRFPGRDSYLAIQRRSADSAYNVTVQAVSDDFWTMFDQDYGGTPSYAVVIATTNGTIGIGSIRGAYQSVGYVRPICGSHGTATPT